MNNRFDDYSQLGAINQSNLRDQAVDLPQLGTNLIHLNEDWVTLGPGDWTRGTVVNVTSHTGAGAATKQPVQDGSGVETRLGPLGWTIGANEILRVYFDLSVRPRYTGTPWTASPARETFPGSIVFYTVGQHCWILSLEWDITDATLTNWVPVNGQTDFTATLGAYTGGTLEGCRATYCVPAWIHNTNNSDAGKLGSIDPVGVMWYGTSGTFYYAPVVPGVTVYGIRVVIHGIYVAAQSPSTNYLVVDSAVGGATQYLEYGAGQLSALHQRMF
jgi:hypothetical protein